MLGFGASRLGGTNGPLFIPRQTCIMLGIERGVGAHLQWTTVARLNIEHYRKLLAEEMNAAKRQLILRLLAEEEAKLASLSSPAQEKQARS